MGWDGYYYMSCFEVDREMAMQNRNPDNRTRKFLFLFPASDSNTKISKGEAIQNSERLTQLTTMIQGLEEFE